VPSLAELDARVRSVIANAEMELHGVHEFQTLPGFPDGLRPDALALVRDGEVWSQLVPSAPDGPPRQQFAMFSFRFAPAPPADGFVSWLSAHLRDTVGSNVIVICGRDRRGAAAVASAGIFDYWGCPIARADGVLAELAMLRAGGSGAPPA
jgi:hypothetical protein